MISATQEKPSGAYRGDPQVKEDYVNRMKEHIRLDQLIKGEVWTATKNKKGCFIGCLLHVDHINSQKRSENKAFKELGIPPWLLYACEIIFERSEHYLDDISDWTKNFSVNVLKAIPVGADIDSLRGTVAKEFCFLFKENLPLKEVLPNQRDFWYMSYKIVNHENMRKLGEFIIEKLKSLEVKSEV